MNFVGVNAMFCIVANTRPFMLQNYTVQDAATTSANGKWQMAKFVWKIFHAVIIEWTHNSELKVKRLEISL